MVDHLHGLGIQRSVWRVVKKYGFMMFYDVKMMALRDRSPSSKHTVQQTLRKSMGVPFGNDPPIGEFNGVKKFASENTCSCVNEWTNSQAYDSTS